jgi:hypothetical protein
MRRLDYASPAAANRYLHTVEGRDAEITSALSGPRCSRRRGPASEVNREQALIPLVIRSLDHEVRGE